MGTGRKAERLRVKKGMTRAELARAAKVSVHTIQRAEQGIPVGADSLDRLAAILGPAAHSAIDVSTWDTPADASPAMAARYARGLPLKDAARQIGISHHTLVRAERGDPIQMRSARAIAGFYGIPVDDVFVIPDLDANDAAVA